MSKLFIPAAVATALLAMSGAAAAETLNYDVTLTITSITGNSTALNAFSEGGTLNVSVKLADGGSAIINIDELNAATAGSWGSTWTWASYSPGELKWDAGAGKNGEKLIVNGVVVNSGTLQENLFLDFSKGSSGELVLSTGWLTVGVYNSHNGTLKAEYTGAPPSVPPPPQAVPELDPKSGSGAFALLAGGLALVASQRRRRQEAEAC